MSPLKAGNQILSRGPASCRRWLGPFCLTALVFLAAGVGIPAEAPGGCGLWAPLLPRLAAETAEKVLGLLGDIFAEVWELGRNPGEEVVRREFFVGEGDDDTYKDFHLVVLIQDVPAGRKMTLQVTRLVPDPENPRVKYGRDLKSIVCLSRGNRLGVSRSDYSEKELASFLPDLLRAIRDRKKLIRDKLKDPAFRPRPGPAYLPLMMATSASRARGSWHSPSQKTAFFRILGSG